MEEGVFTITVSRVLDRKLTVHMKFLVLCNGFYIFNRNKVPCLNSSFQGRYRVCRFFESKKDNQVNVKVNI